MRQVTGNKQVLAANKVSIQQSLDGHSFSATGLHAEHPGKERVSVEVLSLRTMLVPEELAAQAQTSDDPQRAGMAMLAANGMATSAGMQVIWSEPVEGVVALMALSGNALTKIYDHLGSRAQLTTPLLTTLEAKRPTIWMSHTEGLLYIKVYDQSLRFAEVVPATTDADILYLLERVKGVFPLDRFDLHIAGGNTKSLVNLLQKRFKNTICE